eukprot:CAMPEP_0185903418 /NCGR_PEP_ID=MMETSP0196C-20130402/2641_1 /TAXON_ID=2932 /ORGANISM="Alexandrium fundyense, Strain CCMP1719" /LENGTH=53 /DNA_ID=CAMNT_0028622455 /DNA_START=82 /DNA_END=243 /DNA_ORIENTATION=+
MTTAGFAKLRDAEMPAAPLHTTTYEPLVRELRATFHSGKTKDLQWRRAQLEAS